MRSLFLSLVPVVFCVFVSCQKSNRPAPTPPLQPTLKVDSIKVDRTSLDLEGYKNSIDSFTIQCKGNWTITTTPSTATWLKTSVSSGAGNAKIFVSVEQENITGTSRTATVVITLNGDASKAVNIVVTQKLYKTTAFGMLWSKVYGGRGGEAFPSIIRTPDGGLLAVGYITMQDGDVSFSHGGYDIWAVKLDGSGNKEWEKSYGGSSSDYGASIVSCQDGGYLISGTTGSNDGDVPNNHKGTDLWVLKIDAAGKLLWQRTLGGTADENYAVHGITNSRDGGYVIVGSSYSNIGDFSGNHGTVDILVVKLNASGNTEWQNLLGGSSRDEANSIVSSPDGGYMIAGFTDSYDGDVSGNRGKQDAWIVKLDANGRKVWQKTLGGTENDVAKDLILTADGGVITVGFTYSNNGDVSGNHAILATDDFWIIKLNADGDKVWQKTLGGTSYDEAFSIVATNDKGYIIAGSSRSNDGDVSGNHGGSFTEAWLVKIDETGHMIWQKVLGGTGDDWGTKVISNNDGTYVMSGAAHSNDGDVGDNRGNIDGWVVKFRDQ